MIRLGESGDLNGKMVSAIRSSIAAYYTALRLLSQVSHFAAVKSSVQFSRFAAADSVSGKLRVPPSLLVHSKLSAIPSSAGDPIGVDCHTDTFLRYKRDLDSKPKKVSICRMHLSVPPTEQMSTATFAVGLGYHSKVLPTSTTVNALGAALANGDNGVSLSYCYATQNAITFAGVE